MSRRSPIPTSYTPEASPGLSTTSAISEIVPGAGFRGLRFLRPGDIVGGKYRVDGLIGEGGMGVVVAATHLYLREPVALKFLRPELLVHPELVARFAFEARAAAKVKSEHVARVLDVGEVDGVPFMVLEHLEGRDLGSRVADHGPLSLREAAEYVIQACEALAEAHALGIVHRDVKPENLFLVERGAYRLVKLIDFGISKAPEPMPASSRSTERSAATADELALLETGEMMGSPSYMSPEQLTQGRIDARTDIWSLGAVLYELLTGVPLFDPYRTLQEIVASVLSSKIPSVLDRRPDLPLAIAGVLARCLARDPELRFQSAAELAVALLPFAPRRARESAERAVSQVRSSGGSEPRLALPSSEAPRAPALSPSSARPLGTSREIDALVFGGSESELRAALKPAPVPFVPEIRAEKREVEARTVRIVRVPSAVDSSPATAHSVEPEAPGRPRSPRLFAALAACFGLVVAYAANQSYPRALGADAPGGVAWQEREAPSALSSIDGLAEPSREVEIEIDASLDKPRARRARCENPYDPACP